MSPKRIECMRKDSVAIPFEPFQVAGLGRRKSRRQSVPLFAINVNPEDRVEQSSWMSARAPRAICDGMVKQVRNLLPGFVGKRNVQHGNSQSRMNTLNIVTRRL